MAEFVELRSEEWLPELDQLEKIELFESHEIKSVITKRREFEYKLQRKTKFKEDFVKYIQFEVDLYRLIKARRDKKKIYTHKAYIEGSQQNRITKMFKQVIYRFQDDVKLWMSFFKYCQEAKLGKLGSKMLVRLLQVHADKEELWVFAAKWELEEGHAPENARQFLLQGLRHHPESELLFTELFRLELKFAEDKRVETAKKRKHEEVEEEEEKLGKVQAEAEESTAGDVVSGKLAEVVYENATAKIKRVEFKVTLLNIASEYTWSTILQNKIFQNLMKEHSESELAWDVMARRELMGLPCEDPSARGDCDVEEADSEKDEELKSLRGRIQRSIDVYERAVDKLKTVNMWDLYLDYLLELANDTSSLAIYKGKLLKNGFEGALAAKTLSERHYFNWMDILEASGGKQKKLADVLARGTEDHPGSVKLWHARLRFHLGRDQEKAGLFVFSEAVEKLSNDETLPIWKLMIQYYQTKSPDKVEKMFRAGLKRGGSLSAQIKPMYLRWVAMSKGIGSAKKLFETPEMMYPPSLELIKEMISLETVQPDMNRTVLRRWYEMACNLAGKDNLDIWISFVEFELKYGESHRPFYVYMRAIRMLNENLVDDFITRYNALKMD